MTIAEPRFRFHIGDTVSRIHSGIFTGVPSHIVFEVVAVGFDMEDEPIMDLEGRNYFDGSELNETDRKNFGKVENVRQQYYW